VGAGIAEVPTATEGTCVRQLVCLILSLIMDYMEKYVVSTIRGHTFGASCGKEYAALI
jgi:hypothetical protein